MRVAAVVWGWGVSNAMGGRAFPLPWRPHIGWRGGVRKRGDVAGWHLWTAMSAMMLERLRSHQCLVRCYRGTRPLSVAIAPGYQVEAGTRGTGGDARLPGHRSAAPRREAACPLAKVAVLCRRQANASRTTSYRQRLVCAARLAGSRVLWMTPGPPGRPAGSWRIWRRRLVRAWGAQGRGVSGQDIIWSYRCYYPGRCACRQ